MPTMINENPQEVATILYKSLSKLVESRIKYSAFLDEGEVDTKGYFSTLEGLNALLVPFVNLPKNIFWGPLKTTYSELFDLISEDIHYILTFNQKKELPPKEQGYPYFQQRTPQKHIPYWTSECASFTLSVLSNFLGLREKYGIKSSPTNKKITDVIETNLGWIKLCKRDVFGWAWTTDSPYHLWPTWSLLDTFDELINRELIKHLHDDILSDFEPILDSSTKSFKAKIAGSYMSEWDDKVIRSTPFDVEVALDLIRLMLAISLHGDRRKVRPLANCLFSWAAQADLENVKYSYHLAVKSDYIYDSSLVPCLLRTLVVMAGVLTPKTEKLDEYLGQNHEVVINRVYRELLKSRIAQGSYDGLWGVNNSKLRYELYYTERTIESLTEFLLHYNSSKLNPIHRPQSENSGSIDKNGFLQDTLSDDSVGKDSLAIALAYMPILDEVARESKREFGPDLFSHSIIIFVLHLLRDLPPFLQKFKDMGCLAENMYLLFKTYDYPEKSQLLNLFKKENLHIYLPPNIQEKTFYDIAKDILSTSIDKCTKTDNKILIVEDGGYFTPLFHDPPFITNSSLCLGSVEQTTKGHRRNNAIKSVQFPIISVAN